MPRDPRAVTTHFPDDILPSQWKDQRMTSVTDVPERRLLIAILFDAIRLLHAGGLKQRAEIVSWIHSRNAARIPFHFLCEGLDLEPARLADQLLQHGVTAIPARLRALGERRKRDDFRNADPDSPPTNTQEIGGT